MAGFADKKRGVATSLLLPTTIETTALTPVAGSDAIVVVKPPVGNRAGNSSLTNAVTSALRTDLVTNILTAGGESPTTTSTVSPPNPLALSPGREETATSPSSSKPGPTSIEREPVELIMPARDNLPGAKRVNSPLRMALGVNRRQGTIYGRINNGFVLFQKNRRGEYEETGLAIAPALTVISLSRDKGIEYTEDQTRWGILHIPSGRMVSGHMEDEQLVDGWPFKNPDDATMVGRMLASANDWTQELDNLTRSQVRHKDALISKYTKRAQERDYKETDDGAEYRL
jgi:hypothetical protein